MKVIEVTKKTFKQEVINSDKTVLVDFWATWCTPCKMMAPVLEKIAEEVGEQVKVCKLDIDENADLATNYDIISIPTFLVFKNGKVVAKSVGMQDKEELMNLLK